MNNISYLKTKTATILWFIKFVVGVLAIYVIFLTTKTMMPVFKAIGETAQYIIENVFGSANIVKDMNKNLISLDTLSMISFLIIIVYLMIAPLLSLIDAIGATMLRYKESGVKLIKVTHMINAVVCLVIAIEIAVSIVMLNVNGSKIASLADDLEAVVGASIVALSIVMGIGAFIFFLLFCYHKDIVHVMTTIDANLKGIEHKMKKNHLSGISFGLGLFMVLMLVDLISFKNKTAETWIYIVGTFGITLKQFLVSINNRSVKEYNK